MEIDALILHVRERDNGLLAFATLRAALFMPAQGTRRQKEVEKEWPLVIAPLANLPQRSSLERDLKEASKN